MTPTIPFSHCCGQLTPYLGAGTQGPPGVQGPPPALAIGAVSSLPPGSEPVVDLRTNPAGGYFLDLGIPQGIAGDLTETAADLRYPQSLPANSTYRFVTNANGSFLELWNPDTSKWHPFVVRGQAGAETLAIEPGEA